MNLGDRWVNPGDPIPEAASFRNLKVYISQGRIEEVPDGEERKDKTVPSLEPAVIAAEERKRPTPTPDETPEKKPKKQKKKKKGIFRG